MNLLLALVMVLGICLWLIVAAFIAMPTLLWREARSRPYHLSRLLD